MAEIIHNLGKETTVIEVEGCHRVTLLEWMNDTENEHIVNNFNGFVEVDTDKLDWQVPNPLENNYKQDTERVNQPIMKEIISEEGEITLEEVDNFVDVPLFNEDETPTMIKKRFQEYFWMVWESINESKSIARVCHRGAHGRNTALTSDQLKAWIEYFGIENIYTKSSFPDIIKQTGSGV